MRDLRHSWSTSVSAARALASPTSVPSDPFARTLREGSGLLTLAVRMHWMLRVQTEETPGMWPDATAGRFGELAVTFPLRHDVRDTKAAHVY